MRVFTRSQINKLGNDLVQQVTGTGAPEMLEFWRSIHSAPMNAVRSLLEESIKQCHLDCAAKIVSSSRLKRSESVISKLRRLSSMSLSTMQDMAGIRLVLDSDCPPVQGLRDIDALFSHCLSSLQKQQYKVKDKIFHYIVNPKADGYRAVHFVVECPTDNKNFPAVLVEVQLRTKLQHLWAMAVETAGMFYSQALKSSEGSEEWLTFFKMCSAAVSHLEGGTVIPQYAGCSPESLKSALNQYATNNTFFQKMSGIQTVKDVDDLVSREGIGPAYYLLELDIKRGQNKVHVFSADKFENANVMYSVLEQSLAYARGEMCAVLISVDHVKNIQTLYPSYFLDVSDFMRVVDDFLGNGQKIE
jgi:ppGpp synthetase/RelA/SpoT-type nucleotidyltranferase